MCRQSQALTPQLTVRENTLLQLSLSSEYVTLQTPHSLNIITLLDLKKKAAGTFSHFNP